MRMSHIYQPVMLKLLIEHDGRVSTRDIAAAFLSHDESQLDYYETITNRMPGGRAEKTRTGVARRRLAFGPPSGDRAKLVRLCDQAFQAMTHRNDVTVLICTWNRSRLL